MIILDTNVVSEAMRQQPNSQVTAWLNQQAQHTLYLSSVTIAEQLFGIMQLPVGKRKKQLIEVFDGLSKLFEGRILSFDEHAAQVYAEIAINARNAGLGLPVPDGYIAAIAKSHGFAVATRDVSPFRAAGVNVINPWERS